MCAAIVNAIGLALNILGVTLAFFFGYPQPSHEEGSMLLLGHQEEHDKETRRRRNKYRLWSRAGLSFMFVGFLLQLLATWLAATS